MRVTLAADLDGVNAPKTCALRHIHALREVEGRLVSARIELQSLCMTDCASEGKQQLESILTSGLVREITEIRERATMVAHCLEDFDQLFRMFRPHSAVVLDDDMHVFRCRVGRKRAIRRYSRREVGRVDFAWIAAHRACA